VANLQVKGLFIKEVKAVLKCLINHYFSKILKQSDKNIPYPNNLLYFGQSGGLDILLKLLIRNRIQGVY
jgi:hypothetical protein